MPKRSDLQKVMIIGSGPIVIGQACEFDYSGTQAVKALKEEGYRVILVNSNPATIMTDPDIADKVYIEPIRLPYLEKIIELEKPDALLPTVGGQTALNASLLLHDNKVLKRHNVEMIGANAEVIRKAEDRDKFKKAMNSIGIETPKSRLVSSLEEAFEFSSDVGFPIILRPSFTLGGSGGGICYRQNEFKEMVSQALHESPTGEVLIEESVIGWKEFELELIRDKADNVIIICSIENIDPMGIHTGDSMTVAPQQTLTDSQYQDLRDMSIDVIREIGVETGGSNIQFAVNPKDGRVMIIEMNPRVSRSSALASKATGFPIARVAAKLSIGYTLNELANEITQKTSACFEPTIDYIVTKIPRFSFEKFPESSRSLDTQMRSVGEAMSMGRSFAESFQKALRSLELGFTGWGINLKQIDIAVQTLKESSGNPSPYIDELLEKPNDQRIFFIREAFEFGKSVHFIHKLTQIDLWFLHQFKSMFDFEKEFIQYIQNLVKTDSLENIDTSVLREAKRMGYSDEQIACLILSGEYYQTIATLAKTDRKSDIYSEVLDTFARKVKETESWVSRIREKQNILAVFKRVDTCAAEFESFTPYLYSTYESECESDVSDKEKVIILGGGPNRIGQGIEFDYCCCHASFTLQGLGIESIMINSNPETVSTDFDTSSRLYFEPLTLENILRIYAKEASKGNIKGVIVQFGGQTPLSLAGSLQRHGVQILGTSPEQIHRAEDRDEFNLLIQKLGLRSPRGIVAISFKEALEFADEIGYPVLARPSYVLGGQSMVVCHEESQLKSYLMNKTHISPTNPILIDKFLQDAVELDVDAISDGEDVFVAGIMEHIEQAGVHSGDSACILPPKSISEDILTNIKEATRSIALELGICGFLNIQFAVRANEIFALEVNPRASRTVPFVSKSTGIPLAKLASKVILGDRLKNYQLTNEMEYPLYSVKEVVLPFKKFSGVDTMLGPEMKSTGEVMALGKTPSEAYYKAQEAIGFPLPKEGNIFISVNDSSKAALTKLVRELVRDNFHVIATEGTAAHFQQQGIEIEPVNKVHQGNPNILTKIENNEVHFILNIPTDHITRNDALEIRLAAIKFDIPYFTTLSAAKEAFLGMLRMKEHEPRVYSLKNLRM